MALPHSGVPAVNGQFEGRLQAWFKQQVDDGAGAFRVSQFKGGQSDPTFLVELGAQRYVVRRKPPGTLLPSAHAVDREYRVMHALQASGVTVPKCMRCACAAERLTWAGTPRANRSSNSTAASSASCRLKAARGKASPASTSRQLRKALTLQ